MHALVAYDLTALSRLLIPRISPFLDASTPEGRAELGRRRAAASAWEARARELLAGAREEWQAARDRLAGNAPALAVLDVHQPYEGYSTPNCGHCCEPSSGEAEAVAWPCDTYRAVTGEAV